MTARDLTSRFAIWVHNIAYIFMAEPLVTTRCHEKNVLDGKSWDQGPHGAPVFVGCVCEHATDKQGADSARILGSRRHLVSSGSPEGEDATDEWKSFPCGDHG